MLFLEFWKTTTRKHATSCCLFMKLEQALVTKMLHGVPMSHIGASGLKMCGHPRLQLPADAHLGSNNGRSSTRVPAARSDLAASACPSLLFSGIWGLNQKMGDFSFSFSAFQVT